MTSNEGGGKTACGSDRSGMTLLELLISAALSVVLMAVISSALDLFMQYSERSHSGQRNAAVRRGLSEDLAMDLRRVLEPLPDEAVVDQLLERRKNAPELLLQEEILELNSRMIPTGEAVPQNPVYFAGGSDWLLFLSRSDNARFDREAELAGGYRHVLWWHGERKTIQTGSRGRLPVRESVAAGDSPAGVWRTLLPFPAVRSSNRPQPVNVTPQLRSLRFRYRSGNRWLTSWNSQESDSLPAAVECSAIWNDGTLTAPILISIPLVRD